MRTKVSLQYFLGKKRIDLPEFCKRLGVSSHEELCATLEDLGVENPEKSETDSIFRKVQRARVAPVLKKSSNVAARQRPVSSKSKKRNKS